MKTFPILTENIAQNNRLQKEDLLRAVGKNIIRFRQNKGWSQSDLARACDKEPQSIERVENGKINATIFYLSQIAQALDIPLKELFNFKSPQD